MEGGRWNHFGVNWIGLNEMSDILKDPTLDIDESLSPAYKPPVFNDYIENISDSNFNIIYPYIQLFVQHCANVNIPDEDGITPIIKIVDSNKLKAKNKQLIVQYLLQNAIVDVDSDTQIQTKLTKLMPGLRLPGKRYESNKNWDYDQLMMCLQNQWDDDFRRGIDFVLVNDRTKLPELISGMKGHNLLINAAAMGLRKAVEKILRVGVDINVTYSPSAVFSDGPEGLPPNMYAYDYAIFGGHYEVLELLLQSSELYCTNDLAFKFIENIAKYESISAYKYKNCFDLLLNHWAVDINIEDAEGLTALHYAIKYNNSTIIDLLLEKGAYIGLKTKLEYSIVNMNPQVLERNFNRCISTIYNKDKAGPELIFCYKNLVPPKRMRDTPGKLLYEMTAVELLSQASELKHLINHPLIMSFFWFKWNPLTPFFYINLFLCTLYAVASVSYVTFCFIDDTTSNVTSKIVTLLLLSYNVLREVVQLILSPRIYFTSFDNYLDCASIVLMLIITCDLAADSLRRTVAATTIILLACEIFVSVCTLPIPSFAVHFVMLETVAKNFLKCLSLYSIIIVAFALSFYTLFHEPLLQSSQNSSAFSSDESPIESDDNGYNEFGSIGLSMVKTFVMTIGELDAGSIDFKGNVASYTIFVVFILAVTTVLANLLNGLAVSDIGAVKSEAELLYLIRRCQMLARYEKLFLNTIFTEKFCVKYPIKLFTVFESKCKLSMATQHYKEPYGGFRQKIVERGLKMFSNRRVEETQDGVQLKTINEQSQHSKSLLLIDEETQYTNEKADGICREIIDRSFNMFARVKVENDDEKVKNLFARSIGEVNEQLKQIVTDNNELNERINKMEGTLEKICDNLSEMMKK